MTRGAKFAISVAVVLIVLVSASVYGFVQYRYGSTDTFNSAPQAHFVTDRHYRMARDGVTDDRTIYYLLFEHDRSTDTSNCVGPKGFRRGNRR